MKNCLLMLAQLEELLTEMYKDPIKATNVALGTISNNWVRLVSDEEKKILESKGLDADSSMLLLFYDPELTLDTPLDHWSKFALSKLVFVGFDPFWFSFPETISAPSLANVSRCLPVCRLGVVSDNYLLCAVEVNEVAYRNKLLPCNGYGARVMLGLSWLETLTDFDFMRKTLVSFQKISFFSTDSWSNLYAIYDLSKQSPFVQQKMQTEQVRQVLVEKSPITHIWTSGVLYKLPESSPFFMQELLSYFSFHYVTTEKSLALFRLDLLSVT